MGERHRFRRLTNDEGCLIRFESFAFDAGCETFSIDQRHRKKVLAIGFSRFVSVGNQADLDVTELIEILAVHEPTQVIAVYAEDFHDGRAFVRAALGAASMGKPVVLLTVGTSRAGARAARSHTGALVSASTATVMRPAGLENSQGVISAAYAKDASDPQWEGDAGIKAFDALLAKYLPDVNRVDSSAMTGYNMATTMVEVLKRCGDNLTRENVMKQAASLKQFPQGGLLPGVTLSTGPDDFQPIEQLQLMRFKDGRWQLFGDVISGELGH